MGSSGFQRIGGFLVDIVVGEEGEEEEKKERTAVMRWRRMAEGDIFWFDEEIFSCKLYRL